MDGRTDIWTGHSTICPFFRGVYKIIKYNHAFNRFDGFKKVRKLNYERMKFTSERLL